MFKFYDLFITHVHTCMVHFSNVNDVYMIYQRWIHASLKLQFWNNPYHWHYILLCLVSAINKQHSTLSMVFQDDKCSGQGSVRVAERLALPTSDHGVAGSNPAGIKILPEPKRRLIAQSLSCSPFHRLEMTELLLKGRKTLTQSSFWSRMFSQLFISFNT